MSKTTRQALYERLRATQSSEILTTCTRLELPLVRQQARRIGWRVRLLSRERQINVNTMVSISVERQ